MSKIFISYRRQDTLPIAGRIHDRLSDKFGAERVFIDIDSIPYGVDFHGWLDGEVGKASIVLALIGTGWIDARDEAGKRRLDNPDDFVRIEIESALRRDIPLIPVLIGGTPMPTAGELPEILRPLARRNAAFVDMGRDFHTHMDRLIAALEWHLNGRTSTTAHSRPASGDSFKDIDIEPEMVVVPAGEFMMGSPEDEPGRESVPWGSESPRHKVIIPRPFAMGRFAVTRDEWAAAQSDKDWQRITGIKSHGPREHYWDRGNHPIIDVSWEDAQAYAKWLREKTDKPYRLPSEAEWEYAARAGTATPFWWGREITPDQANYDGSHVYEGGGTKGEYSGKTVPVKSFQPNPWGLYQVHGNVWEWCEDVWHDNYIGAPTDGSAWLSGGDPYERVVRGGSFLTYPSELRSAKRLGISPGEADVFFGFRLARALNP